MRKNRTVEGRLAGPTADHGSAEEFAAVGEHGEDPEWKASAAAQPSGIKFKLMNGSGEKTFAVVLEKDDEVVGTLRRFASEQRLSGSRFTAIGAFRDVVLGFFDPAAKDYKRIAIKEQVEVLSLAGDITSDGNEPTVHAHVVVGKSDGSAHGGHLLEAHVFPTLELMVTESPKHLHRRFDRETGLSLIDLEAGPRR